MIRTKFSFLATLVVVFVSCNEENDKKCYSPNQNLEIAYLDGSEGCPCNESTDQGVCIKDKNGHSVALVCTSGKWLAVEDGPCIPQLSME